LLLLQLSLSSLPLPLSDGLPAYTTSIVAVAPAADDVVTSCGSTEVAELPSCSCSIASTLQAERC
jgi:hypothetical protein